MLVLNGEKRDELMWHALIFEGHPAASIAVVFLHGLLASCLAYGIARAIILRFGPDAMPVPPYFVTVTTLLAIVFAFLAADVWAVNGQAAAAVRLEVEALERLADIAAAHGSLGAELFAHLGRYATEIETVEWGVGRNQSAAPAADQALSGLRRETAGLAIAGLPHSIVSELFTSIDQLSEARRTRLHIGSGYGAEYRWSLILILSVFSHMAVAIVHADRPRAMVTAIAMFSAALCGALCVMAVYESPFFGAATIQMPPFSALASR